MKKAVLAIATALTATTMAPNQALALRDTTELHQWPDRLAHKMILHEGLTDTDCINDNPCLFAASARRVCKAMHLDVHVSVHARNRTSILKRSKTATPMYPKVVLAKRESVLFPYREDTAL